MELDLGNPIAYPPKRFKRRASFSGTISAEGKQALLRAVQDELRRLVEAPDFGVKHLASIAFLAEQQRSMLAELATELHEQGQEIEQSEGADLGIMGEFSGGGVIAPTMAAETYGGGVLRELIPAATRFFDLQEKRKRMPGLAELVSAAAEARANDMHELADHLMGVVRRRTRLVDEDTDSEILNPASPQPVEVCQRCGLEREVVDGAGIGCAAHPELRHSWQEDPPATPSTSPGEQHEVVHP